MFSAYFGRYPVMFFFLVVATATAAWCAAAKSYGSFMAARVLNGAFSTVTQGGGMMFIQDMFFFHERAKKINIWACVTLTFHPCVDRPLPFTPMARKLGSKPHDRTPFRRNMLTSTVANSSFFVMSPYIGPLIGAFQTIRHPWPTPFWTCTAATALVLVLTVLFVDETYYDRHIPPAQQPPLGSRVPGRLLGIPQFRSRHLRNSFGQACFRVVKVLLQPTVFLATLYYLMTFAWVVGINTTLSIFLTPLYGFGALQIGYFYFTPCVAVLLAEIAGHWLHDWNARQYTRSHKGHFEPEVRLRVIYLSTPLMLIGLVLVGQALENAWHYMALSLAWGLYVFGIMITTVGISSYCLDSYPEASGEVSAHINNGRTFGGFAVSFFQVTWANATGTKVSFGTQAAICAAAFSIILILVAYGKRMRVWAGPLNFATT